MRETPISSLERAFLLEALSEGKRIDVRGVEDRRQVTYMRYLKDTNCEYNNNNPSASGTSAWPSARTTAAAGSSSAVPSPLRRSPPTCRSRRRRGPMRAFSGDKTKLYHLDSRNCKPAIKLLFVPEENEFLKGFMV